MKFILEEEPEIVEPVIELHDRGLVKLPTNTGKEVPRYDEITKEKIANDVLNNVLTGKEAGAVYGVSQPLANAYARGEGLEGDLKARVLSKRYDIQDVAVVKLMDTLKLLEPAQMRTREKLQAVSALANVVDKMSDRGNAVPNQVHLHLYAPNQKTEKDYPVIEVA